MDGRLLNEMKIDQQTENILKDMPSYINDWYMSLKASDTTASTRNIYIAYVKKFLKSIDNNVMSVTPDRITEDAVNNYFITIKTKRNNNGVSYTSDSYQATIWTCLNSLFNYMYIHSYIPMNYISVISKPKNRDLARINEHRTLLTEEDFIKIINCVKQVTDRTKRNRDLAIMALFMSTGMRKTALCNIMLDDVDYKDKKELVIIDKGRKRHIYKLNDETCHYIVIWIAMRDKYNKMDDQHLFISSRGNPLNEDSVYDIVKKYTEQALGKSLSPHKLRSGFCSILYEKTNDIEFVRRAVGHASSTTTQRYIVTKGDEKQKAAEIMAGIF